MIRSSEGIVIICDRVENRNGINIYSNNLEFSSPTVFDALQNAAESLFSKVYYYNSPSEFIDNINKHKMTLFYLQSGLAQIQEIEKFMFHQYVSHMG